MGYSRENSPLYKLLLTGRAHWLPKGQLVDVFNDGAALNLIKEGYVKRYLITNDGSKAIQVVYGPNDIFPLTPVYKSIYDMDVYSGPEQYFYESMTKILVYSINQSQLRAALKENPLIYDDLFFAAGLRLNSYIHRMESIALRAADKKIAHRLAYLATWFGVKNNTGIAIMLPLTHQDLADSLNISRETVSKTISALRTKGLISTGKHITVIDLEKLKEFTQ